MSKLGFGLIGCGKIAESHARCIEEIDNASLIAVMDKDIKVAKDFSERHSNVKYYDEVEYILEVEEIDIVVICSPPSTHKDLALYVIRSGRSVMIESPIEMNLNRALSIVKEAENYGVFLTTFLPYRFSPLYSLFKSAIDEKRFGKISTANLSITLNRPDSYYDATPWKGVKGKSGGGVLLNESINEIDFFLSIMGDWKEISAFNAKISHKNIEVEDTACAIIKWNDDALGVLEATTGTFPGSVRRIEIRGDQGSAVVEEGMLKTWSFLFQRPEDDELLMKYGALAKSKDSDFLKTTNVDLIKAEYIDFIRALENGGDPLITESEALKSIRFINSIYLSNEEGRIVRNIL